MDIGEGLVIDIGGGIGVEIVDLGGRWSRDHEHWSRDDGHW